MNFPQKILIQLVGAQAQPNVICAKAINPDTLINLYTAKTLIQKSNIETFCRKKYPQVTLDSVQMEDFPSVKETFDTCLSLIESHAGSTIYINYTGGTKPMSIGAFLVDLKKKVELLYVDGTEIKKGITLQPWEKVSLSLEEILLAAGKKIKKKNLSEAEIEIAQEIKRQKARSSYWFFSLYEKEAILKQASKENSEEFKNKLKKYETKITREAERNEYRNLVNLLEKHGWLVRDGEQLRFHASSFKELQSQNNFISGAWWEAILVNELRKILPESEVYWSIFCDSLEDDIVLAVDGRFYLISCKTGNANQKYSFTKEFRRIKDRARDLGGINGTAVLAYYGDASNIAQNVRSEAEKLKIPIIEKEDLFSPETLLEKIRFFG